MFVPSHLTMMEIVFKMTLLLCLTMFLFLVERTLDCCWTEKYIYYQINYSFSGVQEESALCYLQVDLKFRFLLTVAG